jgi:hypothetical protein
VNVSAACAVDYLCVLVVGAASAMVLSRTRRHQQLHQRHRLQGASRTVGCVSELGSLLG